MIPGQLHSSVFGASAAHPTLHIDYLRSLPEEEGAAILDAMTPEELQWFSYDFYGCWAHPYQQPPEGHWSTWVLFGGRGSGKSRAGAEWIKERVKQGARTIALVGRTKRDVREVMVKALLSDQLYPDGERPVYNPSLSKLTWPNGAIAYLYSADEPDQMRGPQHDTAWCVSGDTLILMADGTERPIKEVLVGDMVQTRSGPRRVQKSTQTHPSAPLWELRASDGRTLIGTANHPIWVNGQFVPLCDVPTGGIMWACQKPLSTTATVISTTAKTIIATLAANYSTALCGLWNAGRSLRAMWSTISTVINSTIAWTTLNSCYGAIMSDSTVKSAGRLGTPPTDPSRLNKAGQTANRARLRASTAARSSVQPLPLLSGVVTNVESPPVITVSAVRPLGQIGAVYNLLVGGDHEYFANGLLTHNCDELAAWRRPDAWDQLQFGMRVPAPVTAYGESQGLHGFLQPQTIATTTPKRVEFFRNVLKSHGVVTTGGSTYANRANLSEHFIQHITTQYGGTRLGQQEIHGVMLDDNPDALWQYSTIEKYRMGIQGRPFVRDSLIRIVIGVDPEAASGEDSAETGIIVAGRTRSRHLYVLEDCTVHGTPDQWGRAVVEAYHRWSADLIVGEVNNGGDMVGHVILTADPRANFKPVRASRGKVVRAEPVSAIYEQGRGHHVGYLPELESQITSWMPGEKSPDRMDALVWAATELLITDGMYNGRGAVSAPRLQAPVRLQLPPGGRF